MPWDAESIGVPAQSSDLCVLVWEMTRVVASPNRDRYGEPMSPDEPDVGHASGHSVKEDPTGC
jgi:hypothetical protein